MSIESILLAAFLLLPLLERLIRHLRERAAPARADTEGVPRHRPARPRPPKSGVPAEESAASAQPDRPAGTPTPVVVPAVTIAVRHPAVERLSASDRVRAARLRQADVVALPSTARPRPLAGKAMTRFGDRADLRRAVVLMTVLGPCKALENDRGGR